MKAPNKTIGLVFIERYADWEYGLLAASAVEWFGAKAVVLTPDGQSVKSCSGISLAGQRPASAEANDDLDAVAVIGSDNWVGASAPDVSVLLKALKARGGIVGGICAGTLAVARAGLLADVEHTSNGRDWILANAPDYKGKAHYQDVPHAVADGGVVTAPGSAPGTFAVAFLRTLYPQQGAQLDEMVAMFSGEYATSVADGS